MQGFRKCNLSGNPVNGNPEVAKDAALVATNYILLTTLVLACNFKQLN